MRRRLALSAAACLVALALAGWSPGAPSSDPRPARIVYAAGTGAGAELYVLHPERRRARRLTRNRVADGSPDWSPDGTRIAFARGRHVYVVNADGTGLRRLSD